MLFPCLFLAFFSFFWGKGVNKVGEGLFCIYLTYFVSFRQINVTWQKLQNVKKS